MKGPDGDKCAPLSPPNCKILPHSHFACDPRPASELSCNLITSVITIKKIPIDPHPQISCQITHSLLGQGSQHKLPVSPTLPLLPAVTQNM